MNRTVAPIHPIALLLLALVAGCAGYRVGSTLPAEIKTVHVPTFVNSTGEPRLETSATSTTIQEFQQDGTLRVVSAREADTILKVSLVKYTLAPLRYEKDQSLTAREYRVTLTATISFSVRSTGEVLTGKTVQGESTFIASGSLTAGKRAALPEATRDLAHDIVEAVVEYW